MKAFNKLMGIFGILMIIAAAAPVEAFACVTESGADAVEGERLGGTASEDSDSGDDVEAEVPR